VCVSVALFMQYTLPMRHIVICGLPGLAVFFHIFSQTPEVRKKLLNIKVSFDFFLNFRLEHF